jgi:hypothetical protein
MDNYYAQREKKVWSWHRVKMFKQVIHMIFKKNGDERQSLSGTSGG